MPRDFHVKNIYFSYLTTDSKVDVEKFRGGDKAGFRGIGRMVLGSK